MLEANQKRHVDLILSRLEGVAEGLGIFHPKVGHYINQQTDALRVLLTVEENIFEKLSEEVEDLTHLSITPKEGFEEIDREALNTEGALEDNVITKRKVYKRRDKLPKGVTK